MGSKMVLRFLSISMALLFLGMFFPGLSKASVSIDSPENIDSPDDPIPFGNVAIDSERTISVGIKNQNETAAIKLYFRLDSGETCGFWFDEKAQGLEVPAGEIGYVDVTYKPSELIPCSGSLIVLYIGGGLYGNMPVLLEGMGVPSAPRTVMIDGLDTGVENKFYEGETISYWLDELAAEARNHGQYVRWVAFMTRKMHKANVLSKEEMKAILKTAAHANIPPKESGLEDLVYNGEPVTDLIKACKEDAENNRQYRRCVFHLMKEMKKEGVIKSRKEKHQIRRYAARLRFHGGHKIK